MKIFIVQRAIREHSQYCLAWAFTTTEELFEFFHEDAHEQLKIGLERSSTEPNAFDVNSGEVEYQIRIATKPFYMK